MFKHAMNIIFLIMFPFGAKDLFSLGKKKKVQNDDNIQQNSNVVKPLPPHPDDDYWNAQKKYLIDPANYYGSMPEGLQTAIAMVQNKKSFADVGINKSSNYIFYGPPGVGKTYVGSIFAQKVGADFMYIRGSELFNMYIGSGVQKTEAMFAKARARRDHASRPIVMFFDEIDTILVSRKDTDACKIYKEVLGALLQEIGSEVNNDIIVVAATNKLQEIDEALLRSGRFENHIKFDLPGAQDRENFLKFLVQQQQAVFDQNIDWAMISQQLYGVNYADIKKMIDDLKKIFVLQKIKDQQTVFVITQACVEKYIDAYQFRFRNVSHGDEEFWNDQKKYLIDPAHYYGSMPYDLQMAITMINNKQEFAKAGLYKSSNYVFYGPPGVGKTYVASIFAQMVGAEFMYVLGNDLQDQFVGSGLRKPEEIFAKARARRDQVQKPVVMFIDEIDTVLGSRNNIQWKSDDQLLGTMLKEIGSEVNNNIIVVAATNRLDKLDEALLRSGRFENHIKFELPNIQNRMKFLKFLTNSYGYMFAMDIDWYILAQKLEGSNYADLKKLIDDVKKLYVLRKIEGVHKAVSYDDMLHCIRPYQKEVPQEKPRVVKTPVIVPHVSKEKKSQESVQSSMWTYLQSWVGLS